MTKVNVSEPKKVWQSPEVVVYGDMNSLTKTDPIKPKQPGSLDDFMVAGISNG